MPHRPALELDRVLVAQVDEARRLLGDPTRATVLLMAMVDCTRIARDPDPAVRDQLPGYGTTRPNPGAALTVVRWPQSSTHFDQCRVAIEDAGSTVPGAFRWWVGQLLAAGGDPVAMDLRPKRAYAVAA